MLPFGWELRKMKPDDLDDVLEIIEDHDEDDYEWAKVSYEASGMKDQFVLIHEDEVVGVTGFRPTGTDNAYWLSWTYIDYDFHGQGMGVRMLEQLFDILKKRNARKIFVTTSDYIDPEDGAIYQQALRLYKTAGFREEIVHKDFYEPGESQLIYGYRLNEPLMNSENFKPDERGVALLELFKIEETEDVFAIDWEFAGKESFTVRDMQRLLDHAADLGARSVFFSFPSNVNRVVDVLEKTGFEVAGRLEDFHRDGVHEYQCRYTFS